ncbi:SCO family protein [Sphingomonas sp. MMS24-JH45]
MALLRRGARARCLSGQPDAPKGEPPLAGARIGGPFALTDQNGRAVTDRDFAGKYRIMYFGYTFCPDVCRRRAEPVRCAEADRAARSRARPAHRAGLRDGGYRPRHARGAETTPPTSTRASSR